MEGSRDRMRKQGSASGRKQADNRVQVTAECRQTAGNRQTEECRQTAGKRKNVRKRKDSQ